VILRTHSSALLDQSPELITEFLFEGRIGRSRIVVRCKKFEEFVLVDLVCRSIGKTRMGPFTSPCRFGQCPTSSQRPSDQGGGNRSTQIDIWDFCRIQGMPGGGQHSLLDWSEPIQKTLPDFSSRHAASRPSINASDSPSKACKRVVPSLCLCQKRRVIFLDLTPY
jgi:hypothetical protein